jgi:large subunit ribosomal protein L2
MALKTFNPTTPGQRQLVMVDRSALYKGKPVKTLTEGKHSKGGRNTGRITVRFRGGGHKQAYRIVDFKRTKVDVPAKVERLEYDPNRTAFIALIKYEDGEPGLHPRAAASGRGRHRCRRQLCRREAGQCHAAGQHAGRHDRAQRRAEDREGRPDRSFGRHLRPDRRPRPGLRDRSPELGRTALVHGRCTATIGAVSNPDHMNISIGKAGRKRWMGRRPHNRGVVMNPVDHPHGGGEGRTSGGRHPVTPWGKPTKGKKTRTNKSTNKFILISRHKRKK